MISQECLIAAAGTQLHAHRYVLIFKFVTAVIGSITPIIFLRLKGLNWLVHKHTKIYFAVHMFWSVELSITYAFIYAYDLYRISLTRTDPCDYLVNKKMAMNTRIFPVLGIIGELTSMFIMCIEKVLSTIVPVAYERVKKPHVAIIISAVSIIFTIAFVYIALFYNVDWDVPFLTTFTLKTPENSTGFQTLVITEMVLEMIALVTFFFSLLRNNYQYKKFSNNHSIVLANKYQITENRKVLKNLLPLCIIHGVLLIISSFGLSIYPLIFTTFDPVTHAFYLECIGQIHLYSVLGPLVLTYGVLRKQKNVINQVQEQEVYFASLKNHFENFPIVNKTVR